MNTLFLVRLVPCLLLSLAAGCSKVLPAQSGQSMQSMQQIQQTGGDPARGKAAIERYGCIACHAIPGVPNHGSDVGPPLDRIGKRSYIGGVLANTPPNMIRWLRDPRGIDPRTAMPNMGIDEADARDIASYLYTLD